METIDLSAEVEQPKTKAKAKAKAKAEPTEPTEEPKAKAKAKPRAKPKAKPAAEPPVEKERWVDVRSDDEPPLVDAPPADIEQPSVVEEPTVESNTVAEQPVESAEAATTTRKPKGHRPKIENKEKLTKKVNCKKCDKTVSLHSIKYTHNKFCNAPPAVQMAEEPAAERPPPTLREKLNEKRQATAQRLLAQCFKS